MVGASAVSDLQGQTCRSYGAGVSSLGRVAINMALLAELAYLARQCFRIGSAFPLEPFNDLTI